MDTAQLPGVCLSAVWLLDSFAKIQHKKAVCKLFVVGEYFSALFCTFWYFSVLFVGGLQIF